MTDMDLSEIDELLSQLSEYGSRLMLADKLPSEVCAGLRVVNGDKGPLVLVTEAIDNVLDMRLLASVAEEQDESE